MKIVGLFAGIGGIELGLKEAGHETILLCEKDPQARAVLEKRFESVPIEEDVEDLVSLPDGTELVAAGFPCQDLSQAGRTRGIEGEQSGLVGYLFKLLKGNPPPWVLIENVPFMLNLDRGAAMEYLVTRLEELEYRWAYRVVDSRAFGLPQRRRRVYLLASRVADPAPLLLSEDEGAPSEHSREGKACGFYWTEGNRGLGWAVDAIPPLKGGSGLGIPSAPAVWLPDGRIVTPDIRDAERLQGFEPNWTLPAEEVGRASHRWKLVGNAVSVPAAAWVGGRVAVAATGETLTGEPLNGRSWPAAAWGSDEGRSEIKCSAWPCRRAAPPLADFLQFPPKALSERATSGFYGRLQASSLQYPQAFGEALEEHLEMQRAVDPV